MASIMSSQYPPLPLYGTELDSPHSDYILPYSVPPQQPSLNTSSIQNHVLPYETTGSSMKANVPAANARQPQPQPQSHDSQPSEKKRNKLGYHRTSLACGHCRRRKIRCIPSPSDSQGRCINCIRLKKECSFHPVDQQGQPEPRGKQSSQSSTGSKVGSATSSPASSHANPVEQPETPRFGLSATHQTPAMGNSVRKSSLSHSFVPDTKGQLKVSINQPYSMGDNGGGDWYLTNVPQDSDFRPEELNVASKAYIPESPMGSQFPSLAYAAPPSSAGWTSTSSEMTSQDDFIWDEFSPPTRSMSYGGEPLANRHPMQTTLPIHHGRQYIRRPSAMAELYPSSMDVPISSPSSHPGTMTGTTVPLSAGAVPPPSFGAWNQHPQLQTHVPQSRTGDNDRGPWRYEEMDNYSPLQSNEYAPIPESNPALFYSRR